MLFACRTSSKDEALFCEVKRCHVSVAEGLGIGMCICLPHTLSVFFTL